MVQPTPGTSKRIPMKKLFVLAVTCLALALPAKADVLKPLADYQARVTAEACYDYNILNLSLNVTNGESFNIGTRRYQCVTNVADISASTNVPVLCPSADGISHIPDTFITNAVRTINSNNPSFYAASVGTSNLVIYAYDLRTTGIATTDTMAGGNAWAATATFGRVAEANAGRRVVVQSRAVVTGEVTAGIMTFPLNFTATKVLVNVKTSAGVVKAWVGAVTISSRNVIVDNTGATDFAATDIVTIVASD